MQLDDGALLHIPPGAASSDGNVTFARVTCDGAFASSAFESCMYRVIGLVALNEPLSLVLPRKSLARGGASCVAQNPASAWPCSASSDGMADLWRVEARSFGAFVARAVPTELLDTRLTDVAFEPCGGAIEGRWELQRTSGTAEVLAGLGDNGTYDPYAACAETEHYSDRPLQSSEALEFTAADPFRTEGRWEMLESHLFYQHTITTSACLSRIGEACGEDCTREGDLCECLASGAGGTHGEQGFWAPADPGTISVDGTLLRYCVEGDRLSLERIDARAGLSYLNIYRRAP